MAKVELKNINKKFWKTTALHDFSLEIEDKEFCVLTGPSGCGKTTILRIIAGLTAQNKGELFIDGANMEHIAPKNRDIAMVFQNFALYPHINVYENLAFGLKMRKTPDTEIQLRVKEAADILDIGSLLDKMPRHLSGGEKQRVAVGRAIVRKPKLFLFDEPLSNLDERLRIQMRAEFKKIHFHLGATILYVTHDQTEAMVLGSKICLMKKGAIEQYDKPLELYNHPKNKFIANFFGYPPMNIISANIQQHGSHIYLKNDDFNLKLPESVNNKLYNCINKDVFFGIRPEDVFLKQDFSKQIDENTAVLPIIFVEPMGSETNLHLSSENKSFIVRVKKTETFEPASNIEIALDMDKIHIFDKTSETALI
ncbi:MAG: glycerol-3-phosphate ABC transporter ATP-binding protein [Elusimicrobia bacterium RIFOXYA2_FULL_39_19]|nr:MAG: glycerol-3-phosphate ABC transporter ATP-binding protein [Elusimicrobia bacterium RIFOXYA2_FULL_39_19]